MARLRARDRQRHDRQWRHGLRGTADLTARQQADHSQQCHRHPWPAATKHETLHRRRSGFPSNFDVVTNSTPRRRQRHRHRTVVWNATSQSLGVPFKPGGGLAARYRPAATGWGRPDGRWPPTTTVDTGRHALTLQPTSTPPSRNLQGSGTGGRSAPTRGTKLTLQAGKISAARSAAPAVSPSRGSGTVVLGRHQHLQPAARTVDSRHACNSPRGREPRGGAARSTVNGGTFDPQWQTARLSAPLSGHRPGTVALGTGTLTVNQSTQHQLCRHHFRAAAKPDQERRRHTLTPDACHTYSGTTTITGGAEIAHPSATQHNLGTSSPDAGRPVALQNHGDLQPARMPTTPQASVAARSTPCRAPLTWECRDRLSSFRQQAATSPSPGAGHAGVDPAAKHLRRRHDAQCRPRSAITADNNLGASTGGVSFGGGNAARPPALSRARARPRR